MSLSPNLRSAFADLLHGLTGNELDILSDMVQSEKDWERSLDGERVRRRAADAASSIRAAAFLDDEADQRAQKAVL